jgi:hypothetical protein
LLITIKSAILAENPQPIVTTNFHTDIPLQIHKLFNLTGYYMDCLIAWNNELDFISFDTYPNMFSAWPILITNTITEIVSNIKSIAKNKPIIVMETGYPILASNNAVHNISANWTEYNQAKYASQAYSSVISTGANGLLWFNIMQCEGITYSFTDIDYELLTQISNIVSVQGNLKLEINLIEWSLKHIQYLINNTTHLVTQIGKSWGSQQLNGTDRLIISELKKLFSTN